MFAPPQLRFLASLSLLSLAALTSVARAGGGTNGLTELESVLPGGAAVSSHAVVTSISYDGRYVVFTTQQALLPGDTNGKDDIYVRDRQTGAILCASTTLSGKFGSGFCENGHISGDGRYVVFSTNSADLVLFDSNGTRDVLRKDLQTGALLRVSAAPGSLVAANESSSRAAISADGRFITFRSLASDLLPGDSNGLHDIYWRDMQLGIIKRLTQGVFGEPNGESWDPTISADGLRVAYYSYASNLILGDANGVGDVFVCDLAGGTTLVSRNPSGDPANGNSGQPSLSADGTRLTFDSWATDLVPGDVNGHFDVFAMDLPNGPIELVSRTASGLPADGGSYGPQFSGDGGTIVFSSEASNLTSEVVLAHSVYASDRESGALSLVSRPDGATALPDANSGNALVVFDGSMAFYSSHATNLVPGDLNGVADVFSRSFFADPTVYCVSSTTSAGCQPQIGFSGVPSASANAGFQVTGSNLPNNKLGILFYGVHGKSNIPFLGGALCTPTLAGRTPGLVSGGNPGVSDCSGSFTIDMNAFAAGVLGGSPSASLSVLGQTVNCQFWGRDPAGVPFTSFLSDALEYVVGL